MSMHDQIRRAADHVKQLQGKGPQPMTLASLKRLPIGTPLTLVHCLMGPCRKLRVLAKVQSNALAMTTEDGRLSWLTLPKASDLRETSDGFQIMEGSEVAARYVWGHVDAAGFVHLTDIRGKEGT